MRLSHIFEEPQGRRSPVHSAPEDLGGPLEVLLRRGLDVRGQIGRCPFHDHGEPVLVAVQGKDANSAWMRCRRRRLASGWRHLLA